MISALDKAARRGVSCRIVLTKNQAWANAVAEVPAASCSVHQFPHTNNTLYMHEKIPSPTTPPSSSAAQTSAPQAFWKTVSFPLRSTPQPRPS